MKAGEMRGEQDNEISQGEKELSRTDKKKKASLTDLKDFYPTPRLRSVSDLIPNDEAGRPADRLA